MSVISERIKFLFSLAQLAPQRGKFKEHFALVSGGAREKLVLDYVYAGLADTPKLVPIKKQTPSGLTVEVMVMPQFFSIEGIPIQVTPVTAEKILKYFNLTLPTKEITKSVYENARIIPGKPDMGLLNPTSDNLLEYVKRLKQNRPDIKENELIAGEFKELERPHEGKENRTFAYGLMTNNQVAQDFQGSTMHDSNYVDYSHAVRGVGGIKLNHPQTNKEVFFNSLDELKIKSQSDPHLNEAYQALTGGKSYTSYHNSGTGGLGNNKNQLPTNNQVAKVTNINENKVPKELEEVINKSSDDINEIEKQISKFLELFSV